MDSAFLPLSQEFPKLLADSSHMLRVHMASAISVLFVRHVTEASAVPAPRDHQYKMFEHVAQILVQSLTDTAAVSECCQITSTSVQLSTSNLFSQ